MLELRTERFKLCNLFPEKAQKYSGLLNKKAEDISFVRKGIPIESGNIRIEPGERAAIRFITTPRLDRDGEILIPHGAVLDGFRQSPSVLWAHKYDQIPIGKDIGLEITKQGILAKTVYANHKFAQEVWEAVRDGFLNSNSVGFIPVEEIEPGNKQFEIWQGILEKEYGIPLDESGQAKKIYTKWILLEHSDVPVPSNTGALNVLVSKGLLKFCSNCQAKKFIQEKSYSLNPEIKALAQRYQFLFNQEIEKAKQHIEEIRRKDALKQYAESEGRKRIESFLSNDERIRRVINEAISNTLFKMRKKIRGGHDD